MKAWEICKKENLEKTYKDNNGIMWSVNYNIFGDNYDMIQSESKMLLSNLKSISEIDKMDFEEITNWSKVAVDTKILVRDNEINEWGRRHFAKYKDRKVYAWNNGCTSFTTNNTNSWEYAKLYEEGEE